MNKRIKTLQLSPLSASTLGKTKGGLVPAHCLLTKQIQKRNKSKLEMFLTEKERKG